MAIGPVPNHVLASAVVSLGGLLNGYDTGCIGATTSMGQWVALMGAPLSATLHGLTVSMIILPSVVPAVFAGQAADRFGRLRVVLPGALLFAAGAALQGSAAGLPQFIAGRAVGGVGQGVFFGSMAVYITEIAPSRRRGVLSALPQFMATAGVCLGYFTCYATARASGSIAWRAPYVVQAAVALLLALACCLMPESPRWLLLRGRSDEALRALASLEFDMDEARRDFLLSAGDQRPSLSGWQGYKLLFRRGYRSRTLLAFFFLSAVQLAGIDAITYYAPTLFSQAGLPPDSSVFLASGVSSIAMLAATIPAFLLTDHWGRRASAISGGVGLSGLMFLIGGLYAAGVVTAEGVARWVVVVAVFLFGMGFCATWGIVAKVYASEIQPGNTRGAANSVAMGLSFFSNFLVALLTPILLSASAFGAYFLFGGLTLLATAVLAAYMPETRGRSLEDIQRSFHRPRVGRALSLSVARPIQYVRDRGLLWPRRRAGGAGAGGGHGHGHGAPPAVLEGVEL